MEEGNLAAESGMANTPAKPPHTTAVGLPKGNPILIFKHGRRSLIRLSSA